MKKTERTKERQHNFIFDFMTLILKKNGLSALPDIQFVNKSFYVCGMVINSYDSCMIHDD